MALPRRLILNGKTWRVRLAKDLKEREGGVGCCDHEKLLIEIDSRLAPEERVSTLVHEVLHAVWPRGICSEEDEEKLIEALEAPVNAAFEVKR